MSERTPRPNDKADNLPPEESEKREYSQDPTEIVSLCREYHELSRQCRPLEEKRLELLKEGNYDIWAEQYAPKADSLMNRMQAIQQRCSLDMYALAKQLTEKAPDWNFQYWVVKPRVNEQLRQARSTHAPEKFENHELRSRVVEEYLRQDKYNVDEGLKEYDWTPSLVAARDNLKKIYGDKAERASDYVLISHEITESN